MFETNRVWDYAQSKKILKEKATSFSTKALEIGGFILYKIKNVKQEYAFYKKTEAERAKRAKVVDYLDSVERQMKRTGQPTWKEEPPTGALVYAGDYKFDKSKFPSPQLAEPGPGYNGPNAKSPNPPDLTWLRKLSGDPPGPIDPAWEELLKE